MLGDIATKVQHKMPAKFKCIQKQITPERHAIYIAPFQVARSKIVRWFIMSICPICPICRPIQHPIAIDMTIPILHILHMEPLYIRLHLRIPRRRQQIHKESQHIKSEEKRNNPLKHRRYILFARKHSRPEHDCKRNFQQNERQFRPEAETEDEMFAEMDS